MGSAMSAAWKIALEALRDNVRAHPMPSVQALLASWPFVVLGPFASRRRLVLVAADLMSALCPIPFLFARSSSIDCVSERKTRLGRRPSTRRGERRDADARRGERWRTSATPVLARS